MGRTADSESRSRDLQTLQLAAAEDAARSERSVDVLNLKIWRKAETIEKHEAELQREIVIQQRELKKHSAELADLEARLQHCAPGDPGFRAWCPWRPDWCPGAKPCCPWCKRCVKRCQRLECLSTARSSLKGNACRRVCD